MTSRLVAGGVILASALIAWLALTVGIVARALQLAVALSLAYVAFLAVRGYRVMRDARRAQPALHADGWRPSVTLVVAARNEAPVIGATVDALARQDYLVDGAPGFEVLVVDDGSTDGTGALATAAAASHPGRVQVLRREPDSGPQTKAAVLNVAQPHARGDVIGVVDADCLVTAGFLSSVIADWQADAGAVAIQAQRRERNLVDGWLAAAQDEEQVMDTLSQCARQAGDGTAELRGTGMFIRREALERVGGWNATALTEDLDLSTRLLAAGERIALALHAEVGEEAVVTLAAFWRQHLRWAEGSMRRLIERGPGVIRGRGVPLGRRLQLLAFAGEFVIVPLLVATFLGSLIAVLLAVRPDWTVPGWLLASYVIGSFVLALAGLSGAGERGPAMLGRAVRGSLFQTHWLLVVPAALLRISMGPAAIRFVQTRRVGHLPDR